MNKQLLRAAKDLVGVYDEARQARLQITGWMKNNPEAPKKEGEMFGDDALTQLCMSMSLQSFEKMMDSAQSGVMRIVREAE